MSTFGIVIISYHFCLASTLFYSRLKADLMLLALSDDTKITAGALFYLTHKLAITSIRIELKSLDRNT